MKNLLENCRVIIFITIFSYFLSSCESYVPIKYIPQSTWYTNWRCTKGDLSISPPSSPSCIESNYCFKKEIDFNYCKKEIEDYSDALKRWSDCKLEGFNEQLTGIKNALHDRIKCLNSTTNCSPYWEDKRIKNNFLLEREKCSEISFVQYRNDLDCKYELPKIPLCLEVSYRKESLNKLCQTQIKTYQNELKDWAERSMLKNKSSVQNQINYAIKKFNDKSNRIGCY